MNKAIIYSVLLVFILLTGCNHSSVTPPVSQTPSAVSTPLPSGSPVVKVTPTPEPSVQPTPEATPTPAPTPVPTPEPTPESNPDRLKVLNEMYEQSRKKIRMSDLYDIRPESKYCFEGQLKETEKKYVLDILNEIRKLHELEPLIYEASEDSYTARAALLMAANAYISHTPPVSLQCYSEEGKTGSAKSNLWISFLNVEDDIKDSFNPIITLMLDGKGEEITPGSNLGHRRWFLNPFQKYISVGRSDVYTINTSRANFASALAVKVVDNEANYISDADIEFVAYPYKEYPSYLYKSDYYMSFSAIIDKNDRSNNKAVNYSEAKIIITSPEAKEVNIRNIHYDNNYQGVQNSLQWKADVQPNVRYKVKITGVKVFDSYKDYEYWFEIK